MKLAIVLKMSLLIISLVFLASCASSSAPVAYRSSVPPHCAFANQHNRSNPKKVTRAPERAPSRTTPIGGNYSVRN
ncbi:MAG: hypothetical protein FWG79_02255 [Bacteroidales bacterium]|nr:hypothetical protein [Bacteroidales bacterium]